MYSHFTLFSPENAVLMLAEIFLFLHPILVELTFE